MPENAVYIAIYKTEKETVTVEYIPLDNGAIEIVSASIVHKPVSQWQEREQQRRRAGKNFKVGYANTTLVKRTNEQ